VTEKEERLGFWLSAALDDPKVCDAMKADIRAWFEQFAASAPAQGEPVRDALENLLIAIGMGWDLEGVVQQARDALTAPARNVTERELPSKEWVGPVAAFAPAQGDWVMVPREPTQKMWNAGAAVLGIGGDTVERIYLAMLASAPPAPISDDVKAERDVIEEVQTKRNRRDTLDRAGFPKS
jgi:hypothetical protein